MTKQILKAMQSELQSRRRAKHLRINRQVLDIRKAELDRLNQCLWNNTRSLATAERYEAYRNLFDIVWNKHVKAMYRMEDLNGEW